MTEKDQFKFDVVIGNPPYQEEQKSTDIESSKKNYASPIYNLFIDEAYEVGKKS
ncbi:Eco57I restriction-modification methylase domain-containing protein [Ligilactobacillus animalis]|uniref:Type II restriction m6 adenine DNA methyltransferase, Alw26I/Eco31I/Esp3I family n=1 Tax=Ligilactobacillus animalis TaxID=1605 RepID=A0ABR4RQZ8_9LACO|nr:Eco57I restriction-modification methylase domain-containing protein [Ligilactobacillus animalis]KDA46492.1 type II restriction m6 adenine DNA methyltransferase, Alw26I/Eco31I/Esp3I family [Ligilactobacillus animalis]